MFAKKNLEPTNLDLAIAQALSDLQSISLDSPEYAKAVANISTLHKLNESNAPKRVSPDVLVTATANLAGILLILQYEHVHAISSKAIGFVMKLK